MHTDGWAHGEAVRKGLVVARLVLALDDGAVEVKRLVLLALALLRCGFGAVAQLDKGIEASERFALALGRAKGERVYADGNLRAAGSRIVGYVDVRATSAEAPIH